MLKLLSQLPRDPRLNIRGGSGAALAMTYLQDGDMDGVAAAGRTCLEPGSSIGEHLHTDTEEIYLVLEGHGLGSLDGAAFPVGPGDLFLTKAGHSHGLVNNSMNPLVFFAVLTRATGKSSPDPR